MQNDPFKLDYYSQQGRFAPSVLAWVLLALFIVALGVGGVIAAVATASGSWRPVSIRDVLLTAAFGLPVGVISVGVAAVTASDGRRPGSRLIIFAVVGTVCVLIASYCIWAWCRYVTSA